jgi:hypothetical protein
MWPVSDYQQRVIGKGRFLTPSCHWRAAAIGQADVEASANCACTIGAKRRHAGAFFINA